MRETRGGGTPDVASSPRGARTPAARRKGPEAAVVRPTVSALTDPAVARITRMSASDTVRARIGLAVEAGLLHTGEQLPSDVQIAAALDVSQITTRRALKSLADDGVLVRRRGRGGGTFVAPGAASVQLDATDAYRADAEHVHRLIDRRLLLECALTHHAALAARDDQLDELDAIVARAASALSWADYHAADEQLHRGVARAAAMEWALDDYDTALTALYEYFIPYPVDYLHEVNREHAQLVDALRAHDPVRAVRIIEHHVAELHVTMFVGLHGPARDADEPVRGLGTRRAPARHAGSDAARTADPQAVTS